VYRIVIITILFTFAAGPAMAKLVSTPRHIAGTLECTVVPDSGINLLIHSTREVRCVFIPADGGPVEHYKGETGIRLGLDININKQAKITYSVLADHTPSGRYQLAGKYSGAGGGITLGASVGDATPIRKQDRSIALQPIQTKHRGAGAGAGFTYLYLEADKERE